MKKILFIITIFNFQLLFAQVINDQVVTQEGKFGIGTESPEYKLHIKTGGTVGTPTLGFKLEDGNQLESRVLTTDASGTATWKDIVIKKIFGVINPDPTESLIRAGDPAVNLKSYIELPPGKWEVEANILLNVGTDLNDSYTWIKFSFADGPNSTTESTSLGVTKLISNSIITQNLPGGSDDNLNEHFFGIANGKVEITNATTGPKKYYLFYNSSQYKGAQRTFRGLSQTTLRENYIVAQRVE